MGIYLGKIDEEEITFSSYAVRDNVFLVAKLSKEEAERLFASGAHLEDMEDDGTREPELGWEETESQSEIEWTDTKDYK